MKKTTILLMMHPIAGIHKQIKNNLEYLGYDVIDMSFHLDIEFKYPHLGHKIFNFLHKIFFSDKSYKKELKLKIVDPLLKSKIDNLQNVDYAFMIRPDIYPVSVIKKIKKKTNIFIAYQWDGFKRFPDIKSYTKFFNRFFVFDEKDLTKNFLPLTNFYFDYQTFDFTKSKLNKTAYFVGHYIEERMPLLEKISNKVKDTGIESSMMILINEKDRNKYSDSNLKYITTPVNYQENLKYVNESFLLIDIVNTVHNGLSFRAFESLGYDKKLITNNTSIKKYDFYHPNNIFVIENNNLDGLEDFLLKEYIINEKLKKKYSFTNWIHYVLDIQPYEKINLPKI